MNLEITPFAIVCAVTALVAIVVAIVAWQRRRVPGGKSLAALMAALTIWAGGAFFEYSSTTFEAILFWAKLEYIGGVTAPVLFLVFVFEYTRMQRWLAPRVIAALFVVPVLTMLLAWTNEWHGLIWPHLQFDAGGGYRIIYGHGPAFWIGAIGYSYTAMLIGAILLIRAATRQSLPYRRQAELIVTGALVPWVTNVLGLMGIPPFSEWELTPVALVITGVLFAWGIFGLGLLDLVPIAHEILIEKMMDGMLVLDARNRIVEMNPIAQAVLGIEKGVVIGEPLSVLYPNVNAAVQRALTVDARQTDLLLTRGESEFFFEVQVSELADAAGDVNGQLVLLRDITARKVAEDALRKSRAELSALIEYSPAAIIKFSPDGKILMWNPMAEKMYGWTAQEVLGKLLPTVPEKKLYEKNSFQTRVNQGEVIPYAEVRRLRKDGSLIDIGLSVAPLRDENGAVYGQMSITLDITELKNAEAELLRREKTVALLQERARLGRDLHDSVTQLLYSVTLFAEASQAAAADGNLERTHQYLMRLSETARQALKELRLRVFELRPSILESEGLVSALRQRLELVEQRSGVESELQVELSYALPAPVELAVYWIVQEALNNTLKHANATQVRVNLSADENGLHLEIADNGRGFDLTNLQEHAGLGVTSMQERTRDLGGSFCIDSAPEQGTRIKITLPAYVVQSIFPNVDALPELLSQRTEQETA